MNSPLPDKPGVLVLKYEKSNVTAFAGTGARRGRPTTAVAKRKRVPTLASFIKSPQADYLKTD